MCKWETGVHTLQTTIHSSSAPHARTGAPPLHMDPVPGALAHAHSFDLPERRGSRGQAPIMDFTQQ